MNGADSLTKVPDFPDIAGPFECPDFIDNSLSRKTEKFKTAKSKSSPLTSIAKADFYILHLEFCCFAVSGMRPSPERCPRPIPDIF